MVRRTFIALGLMLAAAGRRAWAQISDGAPRYAPLTHVVRIPRDQVNEFWRPVRFTAEAAAPAVADKPSRRILISGVIYRKSPVAQDQSVAQGFSPATVSPATDADRTSLTALCLTCPHEQCQVDLITDPAQLTKMSGREGSDPLFECGCHFSVFDARHDGARVSGETPRGLFRFRITAISDAAVEVGEIEEDALSAV